MGIKIFFGRFAKNRPAPNAPFSADLDANGRYRPETVPIWSSEKSSAPRRYATLVVECDQAFEAVALLRKAGIDAFVHLVGADMPQLKATYGKDEAKTLLANTSVKLVTNMHDADSATRITTTVGQNAGTYSSAIAGVRDV